MNVYQDQIGYETFAPVVYIPDVSIFANSDENLLKMCI